MDTFTLPVVKERPDKVRAEGNQLIIVPTVEYFMNRLVAHAPAEIRAEYSVDESMAIWSIFKGPENTLVHSESFSSVLLRPCLARIALSYMGGCVYGGYNRFVFEHSGCIYSVALYLANDSLAGFWLRGYCGVASEGTLNGAAV